ncbi:hypothetical protein FUT89_20290 [Ralstonia pseudosolanacearum]|nr:hypothetical protein FUT89_20290 [Ralstonia pseudosolanacearum]
MDTFRSTTRNPDAPGTGTRTRRWRRWGVVALAALLLGESIGAAQMAGGALILAGVLWLTRADARPGGHRPDDMA